MGLWGYGVMGLWGYRVMGFCGLCGLWDWVVAGATPGVAAGYSLQSQPASFQCAMLFDSLDAVLATSGRKSATWRSMGRNRILIEANHGGEQNLGNVHIHSS